MKKRDLINLMQSILINEADDYDLAFYIGERRHSIHYEMSIKPVSREISFHLKKKKYVKPNKK